MPSPHDAAADAYVTCRHAFIRHAFAFFSAMLPPDLIITARCLLAMLLPRRFRQRYLLFEGR